VFLCCIFCDGLLLSFQIHTLYGKCYVVQSWLLLRPWPRASCRLTAIYFGKHARSNHTLFHNYFIITFYGRPTPAILFYRCSLGLDLSFLPPNLRVRLADGHQTLPHVPRWPRFIKFGQKFWGPFPPPEIWRPKNMKISARFRTTSRLDREYFRNATRHRQSENCVASCRRFLSCVLNLLYFGPQTAKNVTGVMTHIITLGFASHSSNYKNAGRLLAVLAVNCYYAVPIRRNVFS